MLHVGWMRERDEETNMCRVTPESLKSCTRNEVANTSCAILSITNTFHVGNWLLEEGVNDEEEEEEEGELRDSKEERAVICRSRNVAIF